MTTIAELGAFLAREATASTPSAAITADEQPARTATPNGTATPGTSFLS
jgi:hypothetical protein